MKTIITLITALLISGYTFAQDFSKYEDKIGVDYIVMTKNMFKLMSEFDLDSEDEDIQQYIDLVNNMENIKIFKTDRQEFRNDLISDANSYVKRNNLEDLMRIQEDGKKVSIMFKPGNKEEEILQLFMLVDGMSEESETILIIINGLINLKQVSKLAKDLNVPGADSLNQD